MEDDQIAHASLSCQEPSLACGEMVPFSGFLCISIEKGGLAIKDISAMCELDDLGFVFVIIPGVHHVHDFLAPCDRHEAISDVTQPEFPLLLAMLEIQGGDESELIRLPLPEILLELLEPRAHREARRVKPFFVDVDVELLLKSIPQGGDPVVEGDRLDREHRVLQYREGA